MTDGFSRNIGSNEFHRINQSNLALNLFGCDSVECSRVIFSVRTENDAE